MDGYLPLGVHTEFAKRMEEEHRRQNHRIEDLEKNAKQISELVMAMHDVTTALQQVDGKLTSFNSRLEDIEDVPAKRWEKLITGIIGAVAGVIGTALVTAIVNFI